jgi:transposase-like protein
MVRNLRQYSKEFKQESVSLALSYANVNQAAKELGIPGPTLHEWVNKAKSTGHCVIQGDDGSLKQADVGKPSLPILATTLHAFLNNSLFLQ